MTPNSDSPASSPGLRVLPPPEPRESLPAVEAPPQNGEALDRWADRFGVRDRLADGLQLEHLRNSYYGYAWFGRWRTGRQTWGLPGPAAAGKARGLGAGPTSTPG